MEKENVLVSACLLGVNCKYNGTSNKNEAVLALSKKYNLIPICPEHDGGLDTPRNPSEISGKSVISSTGLDVTEEFSKGAEIALKQAVIIGAKYAILKERSPSCAPHFIYDGTFSKTLLEGMGITAKLLSESGITVLSETELAMLP